MSQRIPNGRWYGDEIETMLTKELVKRLFRASGEWVRYAVNHMGEPSPPVSEPGDFPGKRSNKGVGGGNLREKVMSEVEARILTARVGTNVSYGKWLQLGTKKMEARPWMSKTNEAMRGRIAQILGKKIR